MKHKRNIVLPVLILPAILAFSTRGDEVGFHPGEGATLTKTFTTQSETSLDDMTMSLDGQEVDPAGMGGSMEMTQTTSQVITVSDEYGAMSGGRPVKIKRTFDKLSSNTSVSRTIPMMGDSSSDLVSASELEGKTVLFTWNGDEGSYVASFDEDSAADEKLLKGLDAEMNLRGLLPGTEVAADDSWEIDPEVCRGIFAPGGTLKLVAQNLEDVGMAGSGPQPSPDQFLGDIEGEVSGTYAGTRDEAGTKVGVIRLKLDISSAKDLTELMSEMMEEMELPGGEDIETSVEAVDMEFAFQGEGELLWNIEAGVLHALDLTGEVSTAIDMAMVMTVSGRELPMENSLMMSGNQTIAVSTGSAD